MENIVTYAKDEYETAERTEFSLLSELRFLGLQAKAFLQLLLILIAYPFVATWKFLFPPKTLNTKKINGQVALVTGSANGLGRAIAFRIAKERCNVAVADINIKDAQRTAQEIAAKYGVRAVAFKVDVSDVISIEQLKVDIESVLGPVDILVNNAGILCNYSLREFTDAHLKKILDVNLVSHFLTVRTFIDGMIERKRGRIVAISSMSSKISIPLGITYSTTKAAVETFMNCLSEELHVYGHENLVHLTTVFPGFIATRKELTDYLDKADSDYYRRLTPEEVADATVKGMLRNQVEVALPAGMRKSADFLKMMPRSVQMTFKTQIMDFSFGIEDMMQARLKNAKNSAQFADPVQVV